MTLSGAQFQELVEALLDAFPSEPSLAMMVRFGLGKTLAAIASGDNLAAMTFALVGAAEAGGWTSELVAAARTQNPGNERLGTISFGPPDVALRGTPPDVALHAITAHPSSADPRTRCSPRALRPSRACPHRPVGVPHRAAPFAWICVGAPASVSAPSWTKGVHP